MKNALERTKTIIIAIAVVAGLNLVGAAWSNPTAAPTGGNPEPPINTSSVEQTKQGSLNLDGAISVNLGAAFGGGTISQAVVDVNGALRVANTGITCNNTNAGSIRYVPGDLGSLEYCRQINATTYVWTTVASSGGNGPSTGLAAVLNQLRTDPTADKVISCSNGSATFYAKIDTSGRPYTRIIFQSQDTGWVLGSSLKLDTGIAHADASWGSAPGIIIILGIKPFALFGIDDASNATCFKNWD